MFLFWVPVWFFWAALTCDVAGWGLCGLQLDPKAEVMEILRVLFNFAQFTPFCFLAYGGGLGSSRSPDLLSELQQGIPSALCPLPSARSSQPLPALIASPSPSILLPPPSLSCTSLPSQFLSSLLPALPPFPLSHLIYLFVFLVYSDLVFFPPQQQLSFLNAQAQGTCGSAGPYHLHPLLSDLIILPTLIVSLPPNCL